MATWSLSPQHKKSAVEKMFFYKDGKCITIEQGFRWATFKVESDERPLTDEELENEDGYELASIANDESWEMWEMIDGCWVDIESANDKTTDEDVEAFTELWEEDSFEAVEGAGWSQDDCEYFYFGPLTLTNDDTGEEFSPNTTESVPSMPEAPDMTTEEKLAVLAELENDSMVESDPEVTDWFPVSVNPAYVGRYQIIAKESDTWPFPTYADWNGKKWTEAVAQWRGLAKDPSL